MYLCIIVLCAQAVWLLTVSCGNLLAGVVSGSAAIGQPVWELTFYALLMSIVMFVFMLLAAQYKYVDEHAVTENVLQQQQQHNSDDNDY